ncbi:tRNA adenosine(34) deaminase TadA [Buchnera aphidicola]|uniref:tRNA adenosine(34) deaminase TadA n=1 Tax=Buchnera aphidicola TaxID=9 RepID=UPI003463FD77
MKTTDSSQDIIWMQHALLLAEKAKSIGEVPVGAVLIFDNRIISTGFNCSISYHDPTAHAEIIALRKASKILKNYRIPNTTLYVTLEPCLMCLGAIINSRITRLVLGTQHKNKKEQQYSTNSIFLSLKKKIKIKELISVKNCTYLIKSFFKNKRILKN